MWFTTQEDFSQSENLCTALNNKTLIIAVA